MDDNLKTAEPRRLAFDILCRVEEGAFADLTLDGALRREASLDARDRALVTELVYGVLRHRGRLDFALARFCRQPLQKVEQRVLNLLRMGAYQMLVLERVPVPAAVHTTVEIAREAGLQRATGFINGILRSLARGADAIPWPPRTQTLEHLQHVLSLPLWLAQRWIKELGAAEAIALGEAMLQKPPFTLRVNTLKTSRDAFLRALEEGGHSAEPTPYAPEGVVVSSRGASPLPGDAEGWYQVQDEASMLIAHLLSPLPGERILDACAAPGGKTTHIAALAQNRAVICSNDVHPRRVNLVETGVKRLGVKGVTTSVHDLSLGVWDLKKDSFDRVLVDAPCSGLGVLRRNPESRWHRLPEDLGRMAALQSSILGNVAPLVKPGGLLLYSLCTTSREETEGVVASFLKDHPDFERERFPAAADPAWAPLFDEKGAFRSWPHRHGGLDAFFAVALRRRRS